MTEPIYKLSRVKGSPISDDELLEDLARVAKTLNLNTIPQKKYATFGEFDYSTQINRFGSWNNALRRAGLSTSNEINISDERLFKNILMLWQHLGRQPRRRELAFSPSTISQSPYNRRFGSWAAALNSFVEYANESGIESNEVRCKTKEINYSTGRDPSLRLRYQVLKRDRFTCCACGASPAITLGVELQVDHVIPWSRGGNTVIENLQTLCAVCNRGKTNL